MRMGTKLYTMAASVGAAMIRVAGPGTSYRPGSMELHDRARWFAVLEHYYYNTVFEDVETAMWAGYKSNYGLPRNIRSLFNCTRRAVDWYPGALYPGPEQYGGDYVLPWSEQTKAENLPFIEAAEQVSTWSNWAAEQHAWVRRGANLGVALLQIVDDVENGAVYLEQIHPSLVSHLVLDPQGHIDEYTIEMKLTGADDREYSYRKEVTKLSIATFKNDAPWDYDGLGAVRPNPYGFVNAVWTRHSNHGGPWGTPVIGAVVAKLEALNGAASSINDFILRFSEQGVIFATDQSVSSIQRVLKGGASYQMDDPRAQREEVRIFKGPSDLKVHKLIEDLGLEHGITFLQQLIAEIENDLPEITVEQKILEMSQASGTTITRALSNVAKKHGEAMTNYDTSLMRAQQMAVAIGGWRITTGAWRGPLSPAQQLLAGFNLDSYRNGQLDARFQRRPLIQETPEEKVALITTREAIKSKQGLIELYGETEGAKIHAERQAEASDMLLQQGRAFNAAGAT